MQGTSLTRVYDQPNHKHYVVVFQFWRTLCDLGLFKHDARITVTLGLRTWDSLMVELLEAPIYEQDDVRQLLMQRILEIIWPRAAVDRFNFIESGEASR